MIEGLRTKRSRVHRARRLALAGLALAAMVGLPVVVAVQTPRQPPKKAGEVVQIDADEARKSAAEARGASSIQLASGLEVNAWATGQLVADSLAIDIDANGVAYVGSTPRGSQWLDTRQHPDWVPEVQRLKTTEDLRQFFRQKMATELSDKNTWITDYNQDGVRDFRDLMGVPERIFRIEDTNGDGIADKSTVVFEGFNKDIAADILGGIMVHASGDVYATIAPDLWRLRDTNGDGILDAQESISHGYSVHPSFSGHDMSALAQGPDGMIYWKIGEIGMNVVDKAGKRWAHPHTGAVLRSNPDGTDFEVYAYGVRNPQEIAFDDFGNLISADNDGDYPGETERIIYIAEGSDTGWRSTWQFGKFTDRNNNRYNPWIDEGMFKVRFTEQPSYITPPVAPFAAGPSGFAYNPGTALDPSWKNHFFVTSYTGSPTNARTFGFTLKAKGAGFELGEMKQMLQGILAPGMKIGPDGAIYLTDWVRGWSPTGEGRLWKLDSVAGKGSAVRTAVQGLLKENFTSRPVPRVVELLRARRSARAVEGAVRARASGGARGAGWRGHIYADGGPRWTAVARARDLGPRAAAAERCRGGRRADALPEGYRSRDPRTGGEGAGPRAQRGVGFRARPARAGRESASAVLRDRRTRPRRASSRHARRRRHARGRRGRGRLPAECGGGGADRVRRSRRTRLARDTPVAWRASGRRRGSASPAGCRRRAVPRRCRSAGRHRGGRGHQRRGRHRRRPCRRWRVCSSGPASVVRRSYGGRSVRTCGWEMRRPWRASLPTRGVRGCPNRCGSRRSRPSVSGPRRRTWIAWMGPGLHRCRSARPRPRRRRSRNSRA